MLYIVGTPIGNMSDISKRAIEVLNSVDFVACEDTRRTGLFLNNLGIKKPLISYYKQKEKEESSRLISLLQEGKNIALVSDAGMPCISDPGSVLVTLAREEGLEISVIPGPSAAVSAVALAGISTGYVFIGFLKDKKKEREEELAPFVNSPLPLVFYCGPHDVTKYVDYLLERLGDRRLYVVKELTKIYEGVEITTLAEGVKGEIRGEYVLIVDGKATPVDALPEMTMEEKLDLYLSQGIDKKEAIKKVAKEYNVSKDTVYKLAIDK